MKKANAISLLYKGLKLTHVNFTSNEYIEQSDNDTYRFDDGHKISINEFWDTRTAGRWLNGWSVFISNANYILDRYDKKDLEKMARVLELFASGDLRPRCSTKGLCGNCADVLDFSIIPYEIIRQLCKGWDRFSGNDNFPVSSTNKYGYSSKWNDNLEDRLDLARYIAKQIRSYLKSC